MANPLYFSDHIGAAIGRIRFARIVALRFIGLLFSRDKQLVLQQLDYRRKYQFDQSFLLIRYRFKRALWYHFNGVKRTTDAGVIALNLDNIREMPLTLTVRGFFQKETYTINITPKAKLQTKSFRAVINKPRDLESHVVPVSICKRILKPGISKVVLHRSVSHKPSNIKIKHFSLLQTKLL